MPTLAPTVDTTVMVDTTVKVDTLSKYNNSLRQAIVREPSPINRRRLFLSGSTSMWHDNFGIFIGSESVISVKIYRSIFLQIVAN